MIVNCYLIILYDCECCGLNNGTSFLGGLLGALDGLDLLQQEGADDSGFHAAAAEDAAVGPGDGFVLLGEALVVVGSQLRDAVDAFSAVAAVVGGSGPVSSLLDVVHDDA